MPNSIRSVRNGEDSLDRGGIGYRGPDRRKAATETHASTRSLAVALGILALITIGVALAAAGLVPARGSHRVHGAEWLTSSAAMLAALAGAVCAMRWRLVGEACALWMAAALLVYSGASIAFPSIVQSFVPGSDGAQSWAEVLRPASVFVVIVLLSAAVAAPRVDSQLRPRRVLAITALAFVLGLAGAWLSSGFRMVLGPALDRPSLTDSTALGQVGIALVWAGLGAAFLYRSVRGQRAISPWIGVMLLSLAESRLAVGLSVTADASWTLAGQGFRLFGVTAGLVGSTRDLQRAFVRQRAELLDSMLELASTRARRRAERASEEERDHDLRAALAGIGGAALMLERHRDQLSEEDSTALARAVKAEIDRLQQIVNVRRSEAEPFGLAGALSPALLLAVAGGVEVDFDVRPELSVVGRPAEVAEAVQNLVDNARLYAPGSPVTVRASTEGLVAVLRIEDRGPGVDPADRERIFQRGWRGTPDGHVEGSGLGLFVASKLVRAQGGDLWVEERPGGGASFVLTLPLAPQGAGVR